MTVRAQLPRGRVDGGLWPPTAPGEILSSPWYAQQETTETWEKRLELAVSGTLHDLFPLFKVLPFVSADYFFYWRLQVLPFLRISTICPTLVRPYYKD